MEFGLVTTTLLLALVLFFVSRDTAAVPLDCDPCIDRPTYVIRAIVHGTKSDGFWQQVRAAAIQAAADMRVDFQMELHDTFDDEQMALDIIKLSTGPDAPDALIVSIPSSVVRDAISTAVEHVPVFGMNSGYEVFSSLGLLGFVSMDEYKGGEEAARQSLEQKNITRALFVNHQKGNKALQYRLDGFQDALGIQVEELVVNPNDDMTSPLEKALEGCNYDTVLLANSMMLEFVTSALYQNGCTLGVTGILLGTFDTDANVYASIAVGKLSFAITQQQHLQGSFSVIMASLYATTGKKLVPSSESDFGMYSSGPSVINIRNLPPDKLQNCEDEAFPVCSDTKTDVGGGVSQSKCGCAERPNIKIAGVTHATEDDFFWDYVFSAAFQAADDMNINLEFDRLVLENDSGDVITAKMSSMITAYCEEGVDGLFVTIPSEDIIPAIKKCLDLNIPVLSINSGFEMSKNLRLMHHISQPEYSAGFDAGKEMIASGMAKGYCLPHVKNNSALIERCQGFEAAIAEAPNVTYFGAFDVPPDNIALFKSVVEEAVGEEGDWSGVGILLTGRTMDDAIKLYSYHPKMLIGSFDTSDTLYDAIEDNIVLFGIDQEQYLQGYLPVVFLTWNAYTKQKLDTFSIETGPRFVKAQLIPEKRICEASIYKVCPEPELYEMNQLTKVLPAGLALAGIVWATSIVFAGWVIWNRKRRIVKASQPIFLLMICLGTFVMALTVISLSFDDSIASDDGCDMACMASPWLFFLGFTVTFAALFSKIWRVNQLMLSAQRFRRVKITERDVMLPFVVLFTLNVIFLLVWTLIDPLIWTRETLCGSGDLSSYGYCSLGSGNTSVAMFVCVVVLNACALVLANYQAYKARSISTEFGESQYVAIIMMSILQMVVIGVPLMFLLVENPSASYFIKVGVIFVICMSTLLLLFVPKIMYNKKHEEVQVRKQQRESLDLAGESTGSTMFVRRSSTSGSEGLRVDLYCSFCSKHARRDANFHDQDIRRLAQVLETQGIDAADVFRKAGISLDILSQEGESRQYSRANRTITTMSSLGDGAEKEKTSPENMKKEDSCIIDGEEKSDTEEFKESISDSDDSAEKETTSSENLKMEDSCIVDGEEKSDTEECKESISDEFVECRESISDEPQQLSKHVSFSDILQVG